MNLYKFLKRRQPCEVYPNFQKIFPGNLRSIYLKSRNFRNFRLSGSLFGNSAISGFTGTFPRKFPYHFSPFRKLRNFWSNGKRPGITLVRGPILGIHSLTLIISCIEIMWRKTKHAFSMFYTLVKPWITKRPVSLLGSLSNDHAGDDAK